jgi:hypothetical protein
MRLRPIVCVLVLAGLWSVRAQAQASHPPLIDLATSYAHRWIAAFSNVVAEERYVQETTNPSRRRVLRSDFLLVRFPGAERWHAFRDVFEVDGKPVREADQDRVAKLFLEPPGNALRRADEIARESARYTLADVGSLNNPLLALFFLQLEYRDRFRFTVSGLERDLGPAIRRVQFAEFARPTILRQGANRDLPSQGLFWIDEQSGRVVKTELRLGEPIRGNGSTITTVFEPDEALGTDVPVEMRDWYVRGPGEMRGVATYGRFRRFQVHTQDELNQ